MREARTLKRQLLFSIHFLSFCSFSSVLLVAESHQDLHICSGESGDFFLFFKFAFVLIGTECKNSFQIEFKKKISNFCWSTRPFVSTSTSLVLFKGIKSHESSGFYEEKKKMLLGGFDGEDKERVGLFLNVCSFS